MIHINPLKRKRNETFDHRDINRWSVQSTASYRYTQVEQIINCFFLAVLVRVFLSFYFAAVRGERDSTRYDLSGSLIGTLNCEMASSSIKARVAFGLIFIGLSVVSTSARIYDRCELARALPHLGVPNNDIATWICIATYESRLDSDQINKRNGDGSWDHGLWQINDRYWVGRNGRGGVCGLAAHEVRGDNLANSVKCVHQIWREHQRLQGNGWLAWTVFSRQGHCRGDLSQYVQGCF